MARMVLTPSLTLPARSFLAGGGDCVARGQFTSRVTWRGMSPPPAGGRVREGVPPTAIHPKGGLA